MSWGYFKVINVYVSDKNYWINKQRLCIFKHFQSTPERLRLEAPLAPSGPLQVVQAGPPVGVAQGRTTWSSGLCSSEALDGSAERTWISNYRK